MDQPISAVEANRRFSGLLREVRDGRSYVVTARGKPIARIALNTNVLACPEGVDGAGESLGRYQGGLSSGDAPIMPVSTMRWPWANDSASASVEKSSSMR